MGVPMLNKKPERKKTATKTTGGLILPSGTVSSETPDNPSVSLPSGTVSSETSNNPSILPPRDDSSVAPTDPSVVSLPSTSNIGTLLEGADASVQAQILALLRGGTSAEVTNDDQKPAAGSNDDQKPPAGSPAEAVSEQNPFPLVVSGQEKVARMPGAGSRDNSEDSEDREDGEDGKEDGEDADSDASIVEVYNANELQAKLLDPYPGFDPSAGAPSDMEYSSGEPQIIGEARETIYRNWPNLKPFFGEYKDVKPLQLKRLISPLLLFPPMCR